MTRISTMVAIKKEMSSEIMTVNQLHAMTRIHRKTVALALDDMLSLGIVERTILPRSMWESSHHSTWGWRLHKCNSHENYINMDKVE